MKIYLAPMEGITGYIFRNALSQCFGGVDRYFTPFITTHTKKAMNARETNDILPEHNNGIPLVPQIISKDADDTIKLIEKLEKLASNATPEEKVIQAPLAKVEAPKTITSVTVDDKNGQTSFKLNNRSTSSQLMLNNEWMKKAPKTTIKQICRKWKGATTESGLDILDFMQVFRPDCF